MSDESKFCGTCGAEIPKAGGFCGACGTGSDGQPIHSDTEVARPEQMSPSARTKTNKKASWSLGCGIVGIFIGGILMGAIAIYLSREAKKELSYSGETGAGLATAGLVLGIISIVATFAWRIYL